MPIYQDELTFVKVDDGVDGTDGKNGADGKNGENGKDTYLHKAWSWSSDGTDRFTGVYPNENLANGQKINVDGTGYYDSKTFLARGTIETSTEIINEGAPTYKTIGAWSAMCFKTDGLKITDIGTKLVFSEYFYNLEPNTVEVRFYCDGMKRSGFSYFLPSQVWTRITVDTEIVSKPIGFMRIEATTSSKLIRGNIKVEYDANSTVFTPSPQDDFNNAYPTFEGYYSSFDPTPSTNPSDYTWQPTRGQNGQDGVTPKDVISGYLTNESLIVPANPSGVVSSYANAYGDFVVYEGQTKLNSGVTYTKVSETGMTSTINSAGRYTMTALTTDTAMAIYRATYSGVSIDKIVIAVKNKQGATGPQGPPTGVTTQPTIPTSPYVGMLWQNTGNISGYLTGATYQWNGAKWNIYIFMAENIVAETLSSIVANTGKLNVTDDITLTTDNKVLKGYFDFGDRFAQAYYDRWFTGDFELGRRYLRYSGDIFEVNPDNTKGKFMHNAESFYGLDYFKMRTYDNKTSKNLVGRIDIHSQAIQLGDSWGSPNTTIQSNGFVTAKEVLADRIGPNSGSTLTIGESSLISGMLLTESNTYFNSKRTDLADFRVGKDGSSLNGGRVVKSDAIYNRTYSGGANMIVTGDGVLGRVTSARKYKDDIQVADNVIKNAKEVLKIKPSSWLDKGDLADRKAKVRYHGFIADEFDELGLTEVVVYDHDGDVDSLNYDRIPIYHNVILSEHEERIKYLENEVAELKEFIEKWKAVQK